MDYGQEGLPRVSAGRVSAANTGQQWSWGWPGRRKEARSRNPGRCGSSGMGGTAAARGPRQETPYAERVEAGAPREAANITIQVQAMDSRSFLDHSAEIAQAVREAMLNMHSLNDVVNDI